MCNPRRIRVTATRQLNEAWQREVNRTIELCGRVVGEARVRQPLDASLAGPALKALEHALASESSGWIQTREGFRFNVEGGYILYLPDEQVLEIVAVLEDTVQAAGEAGLTLKGTVREEIAAQGEGQYYDDGWGGKTLEAGKKEAETHAMKSLDEISRTRIEQAQSQAESEISQQVEFRAREQAEERLRHKAEQRQAELAENARTQLESVGLRCRQAFHGVLAQAYKDSILAYARQNGASGIRCEENGNVVDIEFCMSS